MIDLHVHTIMSDGTLTPPEVVRLASQYNLRTIAITDHDTVAGISSALEMGTEIGIEVVPGVEISTDSSPGFMHILGYWIDIENPLLKTKLEFLRRERHVRMDKILEILSTLGKKITRSEIHDEAIGGVPGRPHLAKILMRKGYTRSMQEGFEKYLNRGAPAYVEKRKLSAQESIALIVQSGGIPVLAHPYSLRAQSSVEFEKRISELVDFGLKGIEVYYPVHNSEQIDQYRRTAAKFGLSITGGTDFHGANKPNIKLGSFPFNGRLPYSIVEDLRKHLVAQPPNSREHPAGFNS
jgi:hypothetical protein